MAVDRVQQRLAGLLTLDPRDLKQPVQLVLGCRDLLYDMQLLWVQDVKHVVKNGLQVTRVQTHLPEHSVFLLWRGNSYCNYLKAPLINMFILTILQTTLCNVGEERTKNHQSTL